MSDHRHAHPVAVQPPSLSLLRLSALERLIGVGILIAALWAAVYWAMR